MIRAHVTRVPRILPRTWLHARVSQVECAERENQAARARAAINPPRCASAISGGERRANLPKHLRGSRSTIHHRFCAFPRTGESEFLKRSPVAQRNAHACMKLLPFGNTQHRESFVIFFLLPPKHNIFRNHSTFRPSSPAH